MNDKVIPFPQSAPASPQPVIEPQSRIIMHIGKQRFAIDISCRTTLLKPVPATVVEAPAPANGRDGKVRKAPRP